MSAAGAAEPWSSGSEAEADEGDHVESRRQYWRDFRAAQSTGQTNGGYSGWHAHGSHTTRPPPAPRQPHHTTSLSPLSTWSTPQHPPRSPHSLAHSGSAAHPILTDISMAPLLPDRSDATAVEVVTTACVCCMTAFKSPTTPSKGGSTAGKSVPPRQKSQSAVARTSLKVHQCKQCRGHLSAVYVPRGGALRAECGCERDGLHCTPPRLLIHFGV